MIIWFTGNTGAGKTTMAKQVAKPGDVVLDGDDLRRIWPGLDFSEEDRRQQGLRTARLAKYLGQQGFNIFVAVIAPYRDLRAEIAEICDCEFVYLSGGRSGSEYPYESAV